MTEAHEPPELWNLPPVPRKTRPAASGQRASVLHLATALLVPFLLAACLLTFFGVRSLTAHLALAAAPVHVQAQVVSCQRDIDDEGRVLYDLQTRSLLNGRQETHSFTLENAELGGTERPRSMELVVAPWPFSYLAYPAESGIPWGNRLVLYLLLAGFDRFTLGCLQRIDRLHRHRRLAQHGSATLATVTARTPINRLRSHLRVRYSYTADGQKLDGSAVLPRVLSVPVRQWVPGGSSSTHAGESELEEDTPLWLLFQPGKPANHVLGFLCDYEIVADGRDPELPQRLR